MPIILFVNLKGGVGKTTNAVAIAECLATEGHRTLLIDADQQGKAGEMLLGKDQRKSTLHDLLAAMLDDDFAPDQIGHYVVPGVSNIGGGLRTLSVIPCSVRIGGFHSADDLQKRRQPFRKWLLDNYDFTIVDCPSSLAIQVRFLLSVADGFVVPCIPHDPSIQGAFYLLDQIAKLGLKTKGLGTLWSLYREQDQVHREYVAKVNGGAEPFNRLPKPFATIIPNATAIAAATDPQKRPQTFKAKYGPNFAKLFIQLYEEIVQRTK